METEIKEEKKLVLKRVPPGDRWKFADSSQSPIFPCLTDALEAWFQQNGDTQFYMDARKGTVEIVKQEEVEKPITKYSLYGED
ncbi:hypothetical protein EB169_09920 [archaeon]|jgi:hypothetical protein|nr:hypothetical protein [archaeon]NDB56130.1 hypothetical protein [archaeon]